MLNIGDIVKPKEGFKGSKYIFKIEERDENNYPYMYKLGRVGQELDPAYGPVDFQNNIIREAEYLSWAEEELELIKPFFDMMPYKITQNRLEEMMPSIFKSKEDNMKILDIYAERKELERDTKLEEEKEKIIEEDEIRKIIKEMENQVNTILENEDRENECFVFSKGNKDLLTNASKEKLEKLKIEYEKEKNEVCKTIDEIKALFELTEDYEERMKILKKYDIIGKDGKLTI